MKTELILITYAFPFGLGETFIENEINFLARAYDRVSIFSLNTGDKQTRTTPQNCQILRLSIDENSKLHALFIALFRRAFWKELYLQLKSPAFDLRFIKVMIMSQYRAMQIHNRLNIYISKSDSNQIVIYNYWANDGAIAAASLKNSKILKRICRAHHGDVYREIHSIPYLPFRNEIIQGLDAIAFISDHAFEYTKAYLPQVSKIGQVHRLGIFHTAQIDQDAHLPTVPIKQNSTKVNIASCSFLRPIKRVQLIINALELIDENIRLHWVHIGDGPLEKNLIQQAEQLLGKKKNISFEFLGHIENHLIQDTYIKEKIDLFINVSISEGVPVSIMEAFALGIPAIATDVGATKELVSPETGILLGNNPTAKEVMDSILLFVNASDEQKLDWSRNAKNCWMENYNADINYPLFITEILT